MIGYDYLIPEFLEAMSDIGALGEQKYRDNCFRARAARGDKSRDGRLQSSEIVTHIKAHADAYLNNIKHDHYQTLKHQLAAVAFNAMMEFYYLDELVTET